MSQQIEFGSRETANHFRDEYPDAICPMDDDRRFKTVAFVEDAPEQVIEEAERAAMQGTAERESGPGQADLTDHERDRIDWSKEGSNVPKARSVKALMLDEGVQDWTAYYDPTLTVDEHRQVAKNAKTEGGGARMDAEESAVEQAGRAASRAEAEECDHARGHCENGNPEACEFLQSRCGYDEQEVSQILGGEQATEETTEQQRLVTVGGGEYPEMEVTPAEAGALHRSWQGYKAAVSSIRAGLSDVEADVTDARQAWAAINSIRGDHGQEDLHPDQLHDLLDALAAMPESIPEVRTLDHYGQDQPDQQAAIEQDQQRDLAGERANQQARLAGGETGDVESEVEQHVEQNPGGLRADEREQQADPPTEENTEQQIPDEFQTAEGGQETL